MVELLLLFFSFVGYIFIIYAAIYSWRKIIKKFDCVDFLVFVLFATSSALLSVAYLIDILKFAK